MSEGKYKDKGLLGAFAKGAASGAVAGSVVPGWGTAVGAVVGGAAAVWKKNKSNKLEDEATQDEIALQEAADEEERKQTEVAESIAKAVAKRKQQSSVPGMKPAYGSPVFSPETQQQMGALSGANPGPNPSLPIQEVDATANALSTLYS